MSLAEDIEKVNSAAMREDRRLRDRLQQAIGEYCSTCPTDYAAPNCEFLQCPLYGLAKPGMPVGKKRVLLPKRCCPHRCCP